MIQYPPIDPDEEIDSGRREKRRNANHMTRAIHRLPPPEPSELLALASAALTAIAALDHRLAVSYEHAYCAGVTAGFRAMDLEKGTPEHQQARAEEAVYEHIEATAASAGIYSLIARTAAAAVVVALNDPTAFTVDAWEPGPEEKTRRRALADKLFAGIEDAMDNLHKSRVGDCSPSFNARNLIREASELGMPLLPEER